MKRISKLCLIFVISQGVSAGAATGSLPTKQISMVAKSAGAREIIKSLLDQSGLKYALPDSLSNERKVSLQAKKIAWADVFKVAIADAGFRYDFDSNGVLEVLPAKSIK